MIPHLELYESHSFTRPHSVQMWIQANVLREDRVVFKETIGDTKYFFYMFVRE